MIATREQWLALAEQCEKATEENYALSRAIREALGHRRSDVGKFSECWEDREGARYYIRACITESTDAITALIERELPGGSWQCGMISSEHEDGEEGPKGGWARVFLNCGDERDEMEFIVSGKLNTALAICAAFCRAMAAKAGAA